MLPKKRQLLTPQKREKQGFLKISMTESANWGCFSVGGRGHCPLVETPLVEILKITSQTHVLKKKSTKISNTLNLVNYEHCSLCEIILVAMEMK